MLAPAGFLVLLVLASVSVDSAVAFLGQRQLESAVTAAANDAATATIPEGNGPNSLQADDRARPNSGSAQQLAADSALRSYSGALTARSVDVTVDGPLVTVAATGDVEYIFAKAIPGMRHRQEVKAQAQAEVRFR